MAAEFSKVSSLIIAAEGGYVNGNNDYGEATKYGISQRQYPHVDIAALTPERALAILDQDYWQHYHCNEINDQIIANQVFFMFVNMDPVHATKIIQTACNEVGSRLELDGIMGSATINAINSLPCYWVSDQIRLELIRYYLKLSDEDESQRVNFRGWVRRALQ